MAEELRALKDRLATGQAAYQQLRAERDDLAEMLIEADRRHHLMATVIGHWDDLATRLHHAVTGHPSSPHDAAILTFWAKARDRLHQHAATPPSTGNPTATTSTARTVAR
ncbi:hypothetical protein [Nesterenkonia sp. K-15-9-6]|uniref:hypothetical protein n=1 Tax=Nesterenkonia sp. K-15-9-6 TaxID=3093918 RepID=UPI004043C9CE